MHGISTDIKKDERNRARKYFQRARFGQSKTKRIALMDISADCAENDSRNYVSIEALVLAHCKLKIEIINIDTNKL